MEINKIFISALLLLFIITLEFPREKFVLVILTHQHVTGLRYVYFSSRLFAVEKESL